MYHAIVFLPLIGALIAGFGGRAIGAKASEYVTTLFLIVAALLSWVAFFTIAIGEGEMLRIPVMRWIDSGSFSVDWALRIDTLTAVMLVVVNTVSCLVHVYSIGYMHHDPHRPRFFAYLSFFTFAMLMLVTSDNLLQMFFGWEGVGVASYLLIGFWYKKPSANAAAMKAFIVNRVGDFGFLLGIFGLFVLFGSASFDAIFAGAADYLPAEGAGTGETVLTLFGMQARPRPMRLTRRVPAAVSWARWAKSAQFLLHTWLPEREWDRPRSPVSGRSYHCRNPWWTRQACSWGGAHVAGVRKHAPDALVVVTWVGRPSTAISSPPPSAWCRTTSKAG